MLHCVSLLPVPLFVTIVSNSLKGERKKNAKTKNEPKSTQFDKLSVPKALEARKYFWCSYPSKS